MTVHQEAINTRALMAAAAKVERIGYEGDAYRFVEGLALSVLADGYRKLEPPPPLRGAGSTRKAIDEAKAATAEAVAHARHKRTEGGGR